MQSNESQQLVSNLEMSGEGCPGFSAHYFLLELSQVPSYSLPCSLQKIEQN